MKLNKKIIIIALVVIVVFYFIYQQTKAKAKESGIAEGNKYANDAMLDSLSAGSTLESSTIITDDMTLAEKEVAKAKQAEELAEYNKMLDLQAEYLTLTGKSGKGLTSTQLQTLINEYKRTSDALLKYIAISGDTNANINDERYDTLAEVQTLMANAEKKKKDDFNKAVSDLKAYYPHMTSAVIASLKTIEDVNRKKDDLKAKEKAWSAVKSGIDTVIDRFITTLKNRGTAGKQVAYDEATLKTLLSYEEQKAAYANQTFYRKTKDPILKTPENYGALEKLWKERRTISEAFPSGNAHKWRAGNTLATKVASHYLGIGGKLDRVVNQWGEFN